MPGFPAAETEVLFTGKLLGCFVEARDTRSYGCWGGRLGRGWGCSGRAERVSSFIDIVGGFRFTGVRVVELDEVLFNPTCAFDELG